MRYKFLCFLLLWAGWLWADNISEEQARQVASAFLQSSPQTRGAASALQLVLDSESLLSTRSSDAAPAYYVFDVVSGGGFVVVAGDDVAHPVLGYSFDEEFPSGPLSPNLQDWLEGLRREINVARRDGVQASAGVQAAWADIRAGNPVVKLETARWDQGDPYNRLCPQVDGQPTYTGCSATALAIVMRYHAWPERGVGAVPAYTTTTYGLTVPELPLGHAYAWDYMPLSDLAEGCTEAEANAVATLMRDCSRMLVADYCPVGSSGTSAYASMSGSVLATYMGYDKGGRYVSRNDFATAEWHEILQNELNEERLIIYAGSNSESGHAFVLDGYTTDNYYSVNWGWGGYCNGYFLLTALEPTGQGAGGSGTYNEEQYAVIGIQKDTGNGYVEDLRFSLYTSEEGTFNGLEVEGNEVVTQNTPFTLRVGFLQNQGSATFVGELLLAVADKDGQIVEELYKWSVGELPVGYGYNISQEVCITVPILPGYRIRAYYRSERHPDWTLVRGNEENGCVWDYILMDESSIEASTVFTYHKNERRITLTVKQGVAVSLLDAAGNDRRDACSTRGSEVTVDVSLLGVGTYTLVLEKRNERKELQISL